jgi:hypothetical protein
MKLNLTPKEYSDFTAIYLLDYIINEDEFALNDAFAELMDNLKGKGAKSVLLRYYLNLPASLRMQYRRVRGSLIGKKPGDTLLKIEKERGAD